MDDKDEPADYATNKNDPLLGSWETRYYKDSGPLIIVEDDEDNEYWTASDRKENISYYGSGLLRFLSENQDELSDRLGFEEQQKQIRYDTKRFDDEIIAIIGDFLE